jgi:hypothetical protein
MKISTKQFAFLLAILLGLIFAIIWLWTALQIEQIN